MTDATPTSNLFESPMYLTNGQPVTEELPLDITLSSPVSIVSETNWRTEAGTPVSLVRHIYYTTLPSQPGQMKYVRYDLTVGTETLNVQKVHTRFRSDSGLIHTVTLLTTEGKLLMIHNQQNTPTDEFVHRTYWNDSLLTFLDRGTPSHNAVPGHYSSTPDARFEPIWITPDLPPLPELIWDRSAASAIKTTALLPIPFKFIELNKTRPEGYLFELDNLDPGHST